jgi:hypothetical protein
VIVQNDTKIVDFFPLERILPAVTLAVVAGVGLDGRADDGVVVGKDDISEGALSEESVLEPIEMRK